MITIKIGFVMIVYFIVVMTIVCVMLYLILVIRYYINVLSIKTN